MVEIQAPQPHEERSLVSSLAIAALIIGILAFIVGFAVGKISLAASSSQGLKQQPTAVAGWSLYTDKDNLFALSYPPDWKAQKHAKADADGVQIQGNKGYVDTWLLVDQPFLLGEKQQNALSGQNTLEVDVRGNKASGTLYKYKAGNYFLVLVLGDTTTTPQVTFWAQADDDTTKDTVLKIIGSFNFLN